MPQVVLVRYHLRHTDDMPQVVLLRYHLRHEDDMPQVVLDRYHLRHTDDMPQVVLVWYHIQDTHASPPRGAGRSETNTQQVDCRHICNRPAADKYATTTLTTTTTNTPPPPLHHYHHDPLRRRFCGPWRSRSNKLHVRRILPFELRGIFSNFIPELRRDAILLVAVR